MMEILWVLLQGDLHFLGDWGGGRLSGIGIEGEFLQFDLRGRNIAMVVCVSITLSFFSDNEIFEFLQSREFISL